MRLARTLPAVLLLALTTLAACGGGAPSGPAAGGSGSTGTSSAGPSTGTATSPSAGPSTGPASSPMSTPPASSSTSASASSPATPSSSGTPRLPSSRTQAAQVHVAVLDRNAARTAQEHAVVDAWMSYWQAAADSYYRARPVPRFAEVARGSARSAVLVYLRQKKAQGQRVVGWARDNVTSVHISGNRARLRDCTQNFTFSVDEEGTPITLPTPFYDVTGALEKHGGRWVVTVATSRDLRLSCLR